MILHGPCLIQSATPKHESRSSKLLRCPERWSPEHKFSPKTPLLSRIDAVGCQVYHSQEWYDRELERVFLPSWTVMGREDELEEPGSYLAIDTEWGGPVAVARGNDGRLHAFANVCCHRGAKVIQDEKGKASSVGFVCPYHAWTYDFDGKLKWAPGTDACSDFHEDGVQMTPLRLETFHGFVFVCLSNETPSLAECLGDLQTQLPAWFGPEGAAKDMICVKRREYTVQCNWKFVMEVPSHTHDWPSLAPFFHSYIHHASCIRTN